MRRNLLIFRHGEAAYSHPGQRDFDRPLSPYGEQQVRQLAAWLGQRGLRAQRLFASAACRTQTTAEGVAPVLGLSESQIYADTELYLAPGTVWVKLLSQLPNHLTSVAIVGHNPGLNSLCHDLTGTFDMVLDPAGVVCLALQLPNWEDVSHTEGTCLAHFQPG